MTYRILCIFILILDIEKGFDIPENKFKDLLLMMYKNFGSNTSYQNRAEYLVK